ncbi:hypothetical protein SCP_1500340 [Sparassis crispa]|uniref:Uncharacterized protein n=1 Tax=Sparassis crispa TaxID=139825 RepID=A0A401H3P9_9APHY|nr:hypothetical protein SCP_1500340 [Sparassis crispa]GBE89032.1 hypothetical protein SCP_1500340 [Sparassis crispa]
MDVHPQTHDVFDRTVAGASETADIQRAVVIAHFGGGRLGSPTVAAWYGRGVLREMFEHTIVDQDTGAIRFKKTEEWINTYNVRAMVKAVMDRMDDVKTLGDKMSGATRKLVTKIVNALIAQQQTGELPPVPQPFRIVSKKAQSHGSQQRQPQCMNKRKANTNSYKNYDDILDDDA